MTLTAPAALLIQLASVSASQSTDCSAGRRVAIVAAIDAAVAAHPTMSGRVLVSHCGQVVVDRSVGWADRAANKPANRRTIFDVGSLTKQFVAATILDLRDAGRLSLDDHLRKYFPDVSPEVGSITLHQLLTHSSGLPMYSGDDYDVRTTAQFTDWLRHVKLEHAPGETYRYSNPGYSVLALIAERQSGQNLEAYLRRRFFNRLGLRSTGYRGPKGPLAVNYFADGRSDGTPREKQWRAIGPYWNLYGNGGMLSTASDLRAWFTALRSGKLLSHRSTREMFTAHLVEPDNRTVGIGYGWRVIRDQRGPWIEHGGSNGESFFANVRYFERSDALMILTLNRYDLDEIKALVRAFAQVVSPLPNEQGK